MAEIRSLFWRSVTAADFFNVERSREAAPSGGGGQSYFSVSFTGLDHEELGVFLGVDPPSLIRTERPTVVLEDVAVIDDPTTVAHLTFAARYRPPKTDDRYRITRQNRQYQVRHPAWTESRGFPRAPDDVLSAHDPRMPDLSRLKLYVAKLDDGTYRAGFANSGHTPAGAAGVSSLSQLFSAYDRDESAGIIEFASGEMPLETWLGLSAEVAAVPDAVDTPPEVLEARDATRVAAGKRPRGQGRRLNAPERQAIELRAMALTAQHFEREGWRVDDVSAYRPYDLVCRRASEELRVEVKGTTGDGSVLLLTPGEVKHARAEVGRVALAIVSGIELQVGDEVVATGGSLRMVHPWEIADSELRPTGFEYRQES